MQPLYEDIPFYFGIDQRNLGDIHDNSTSKLEILYQMPLSSLEKSKTFTTNSGDGFDAAVRLLTNGIDNSVRVILNGSRYGGGGTLNEQRFFWSINGNNPSNPQLIDLSYYAIHSITLTIDDILRNVPVTYDGINYWQSMVGVSLTMDVTQIAPLPSSSSVPIPAAIWFLGSGLVGLVGVRRKMKI